MFSFFLSTKNSCRIGPSLCGMYLSLAGLNHVGKILLACSSIRKIVPLTNRYIRNTFREKKIRAAVLFFTWCALFNCSNYIFLLQCWKMTAKKITFLFWNIGKSIMFQLWWKCTIKALRHFFIFFNNYFSTANKVLLLTRRPYCK